MMKYSKKCYNHCWNFRYHHDGDSGIDFNDSYDVIGNSSEVSTIDFKIQCEMTKEAFIKPLFLGGYVRGVMLTSHDLFKMLLLLSILWANG